MLFVFFTEALRRVVAPAAALLAGGRRGSDALHAVRAAVDDRRAQRRAQIGVLDPAVVHRSGRAAVDFCPSRTTTTATTTTAEAED